MPYEGSESLHAAAASRQKEVVLIKVGVAVMGAVLSLSLSLYLSLLLIFGIVDLHLYVGDTVRRLLTVHMGVLAFVGTWYISLSFRQM